MISKLGKITNLTDPIKQYLLDFNLVLPSDTFDVTSEELLLRAQSFTFPKVTMDKTEVNWGGINRQFAGKQTRQGDWELTFTEVFNGDVIDGFIKWMNKAHNYVAGTIANSSEYFSTAYVRLLNAEAYAPLPDGAISKGIFLKDIFPLDVSVDGNINPSSSDPVNIKVIMHYNHFLTDEENAAQ